MAIHKEEVDVEYPDCDVCGKDIGGADYLLLELTVSRARSGYTEGSIEELHVCKDCVERSLWKGRLDELAEVAIGELKWERGSRRNGST